MTAATVSAFSFPGNGKDTVFGVRAPQLLW